MLLTPQAWFELQLHPQSGCAAGVVWAEAVKSQPEMRGNQLRRGRHRWGDAMTNQ